MIIGVLLYNETKLIEILLKVGSPPKELQCTITMCTMNYDVSFWINQTA
jgi:hypothetical protein